MEHLSSAPETQEKWSDAEQKLADIVARVLYDVVPETKRPFSFLLTPEVVGQITTFLTQEATRFDHDGDKEVARVLREIAGGNDHPIRAIAHRLGSHVAVDIDYAPQSAGGSELSNVPTVRVSFTRPDVPVQEHRLYVDRERALVARAQEGLPGILPLSQANKSGSISELGKALAERYLARQRKGQPANEGADNEPSGV